MSRKKEQNNNSTGVECITDSEEIELLKKISESIGKMLKLVEKIDKRLSGGF